jgi:hypothetical protein
MALLATTTKVVQLEKPEQSLFEIINSKKAAPLNTKSDFIKLLFVSG